MAESTNPRQSVIPTGKLRQAAQKPGNQLKKAVRSPIRPGRFPVSPQGALWAPGSAYLTCTGSTP